MLTLAVEKDQGRDVDFTIRLQTLSFDGHVWVSQLAGGDDLLSKFGPAVSKSRRVGANSKLPSCNAIP
jgi:hypothetical protein